eukprot:scaffold19978_cov32-Prasinocladus_malaysianus.AAC.2
MDYGMSDLLQTLPTVCRKKESQFKIATEISNSESSRQPYAKCEYNFRTPEGWRCCHKGPSLAAHASCFSARDLRPGGLLCLGASASDHKGPCLARGFDRGFQGLGFAVGVSGCLGCLVFKPTKLVPQALDAFGPTKLQARRCCR